LRCNNIRESLLAFLDDRFKSTNGGPKVDPGNPRGTQHQHSRLIALSVPGRLFDGTAESRHSNLFEAYFGISAKEAESWSMHEFEDIETHQLFQKHSLLITNGVARDSLEAFKAFERAMGGLVRLADKEMDVSNTRTGAVRCAREAIATAEVDEEIARRFKLFAYAMREK
jgi:hypothetical protein